MFWLATDCIYDGPLVVNGQEPLPWRMLWSCCVSKRLLLIFNLLVLHSAPDSAGCFDGWKSPSRHHAGPTDDGVLSCFWAIGWPCAMPAGIISTSPSRQHFQVAAERPATWELKAAFQVCRPLLWSVVCGLKLPGTCSIDDSLQEHIPIINQHISIYFFRSTEMKKAPDITILFISCNKIYIAQGSFYASKQVASINFSLWNMPAAISCGFENKMPIFIFVKYF